MPSISYNIPAITMQIAEILSDLTSLRVCVCSTSGAYTGAALANTIQDYEAAIALVSSHEITATGEKGHDISSKSIARPSVSRQSSVLKDDKDDLDLQRAMDLVDLHYGVKEKHKHGNDVELQKARQDVRRAMAGMHKAQNTGQRDPRISQH